MKIEFNNQIINLDLKDINILIEKEKILYEKLLTQLECYFTNHQKVNATFYEDDEEIINSDKYYMINFQNLKNISEYTKEIEKELQNFLELILVENEEYFKSVFEYISNINQLKNDRGFIKLARIMLEGIQFEEKEYFEYKKMKLKDICKLIIFSIQSLSTTEKILVYINVLIFKNKNKTCLVYIDDINNQIINWYNKINNENIKLLINNDKLTKNIEYLKFAKVSITKIESNNKQLISTDINEVYYYSLIWSKKIEMYKQFTTLKL